MEERLLAALDQLHTHGTWLAFLVSMAIVVGWIVFALLLRRLSSYHDEKGKNIATKEDVAELTRLTEQVRHEFELSREASSQQNRLQLAALDKRLEAHQAAFRVWHQFAVAHRFSRHGKAEEADEVEVKAALAAWNELWEKQSLYLGKETREAMVRLVSLHRERLLQVKDYNQKRFGLAVSLTRLVQPDPCMEEYELRQRLRPFDDGISSVRDLIEQGVHLPPLRDEKGSQQQ